jgi:hypothetical protein
MALDKFKSNLSKQDLERQLNEKWGSEVVRIRTEMLTDFYSFLKSEGFTITRNDYSVKAQYETAIISIEIVDYHREQKEFKPTSLECHANIKYNKWGSDVQLKVYPYAINQPITEKGKDNCYYEYHKVLEDMALLKDYVTNFKPIKYEFGSCMENDRSKLSFFGKIVTNNQHHQTDRKEFKSIKDLVEAVLNDEFSFKGIW